MISEVGPSLLDLDRVAEVIERRLATVALQPVVDLSARATVGYEALARFPGELAPPDVWFTEARALGLEVELGLAAAERALAELPAVPEHCFLSINVTPATLCAPEFDRLLDGVSGDRVVIELVDPSSTPSDAVVADRARALRRRQFRLAADDLGVEATGLAAVLALAPDIIKLDRSITAAVAWDGTLRAVTAALVQLAEQGGAVVVAEGIETQAELEAVRAVRVRWGQGYLLGRPAPRTRL